MHKVVFPESIARQCLQREEKKKKNAILLIITVHPNSISVIRAQTVNREMPFICLPYLHYDSDNGLHWPKIDQYLCFYLEGVVGALSSFTAAVCITGDRVLALNTTI